MFICWDSGQPVISTPDFASPRATMSNDLHENLYCAMIYKFTLFLYYGNIIHLQERL